MSFLKFAVAQFDVVDPENLDAPIFNVNSEDYKKATAQFKQTVAKAKKALKLSQDFIYVRTRAIGSLEKWGPNQNGDGFPIKELKSSYQTFVGKGNFIDHKSDDISKIRGLIVDAYMNDEDQCVECLIAVDKISHPQLARDIDTGVVNSVSMGTRVGWSECSVCGNIARTENDYCSHIKGYKGMKVGMFTNNEKHRYGIWPVHEINHELEFIELSWVAVPAFKEANVLERIASLKKTVEENREIKVPENLQSIAESARCKDTECNCDIRKNNNENSNTREANMQKESAGMQRIKITVDELTFRKTFKDFKAKGKVTINEKDYDWWSKSKDKKTWVVNVDEDGSDLISAHAIEQITNAVTELLNTNQDNSDLIIASDNSDIKTAYLHSQHPDPLMEKTLEERAADPKLRKETVYDNKSLEIPETGDKSSRELEQKAFEESAKEGASGPLGKDLKKEDETLRKEEFDYKEHLKRAYLKYKTMIKDSKNLSGDL